ncbi:MAG TPA: M28 family peptidase [Ktedonobacteraceae bacterium]|nr:M28 family peptidase [Ktedonobacteraceae bacterium]
MLRRTIYLFIVAITLALPATSVASGYTGMRADAGSTGFPTIDPDYIYNQLFYMVTHYQHREAGYDNNLPVNINGHDEFATYWSQEIMKDLQGFGPQVRHDPFPVQGWRGRPATVPAFNVEVTVPGVVHPEQIVVIGCHYDGEASSTQSANDDGSGCAIELGVARAMGAYWRGHHLYPARTLRFVLFDAEEQGLFGSFHYLNSTINGDVKNLVAMFNEEQNGIAYPLRYLGQASNSLLPFYIDMSPLQDNAFYAHQDRLSTQQQQNISHFRALMQQAVIASFQQFQALGFQMLSYHNGKQGDVFQPIFTPDQLSYIHQEDDTLGGSDQIPFTLAGLPCATFVGNSTYYDSHPPLWSYPFDQPQDTIQLMNTYADGSSQQSHALTLALALPGMLTTWMLNQPDILGAAPAGQNPIAAISDVGQTVAGQSFTLDARASFDPNDNALTYAWNFGDGTQASGITATHTYTKTGTYTLELTVSSPKAARHIFKTINVVTRPTSYDNPYAKFPQNGYPPSNPQVIYPVPNDNLSDKVTTSALATISTTGTTSLPIILIAGVVTLGLLLIAGILVVTRRRKSEA